MDELPPSQPADAEHAELRARLDAALAGQEDLQRRMLALERRLRVLEADGGRRLTRRASLADFLSGPAKPEQITKEAIPPTTARQSRHLSWHNNRHVGGLGAWRQYSVDLVLGAAPRKSEDIKRKGAPGQKFKEATQDGRILEEMPPIPSHVLRQPPDTVRPRDIPVIITPANSPDSKDAVSRRDAKSPVPSQTDDTSRDNSKKTPSVKTDTSTAPSKRRVLKKSISRLKVNPWSLSKAQSEHSIASWLA